MKTFKEFLTESQSIHTGLKSFDWAEADASIRKLGKAFGKEVGVFGLKDLWERYIYLPEDEIRRGTFKHLDVKPGEYIVRYVTVTTAIGNGQAPLVKINPSKGLVWFLKDYEADDADLEFETRSQKMSYIRTSLR